MADRSDTTRAQIKLRLREPLRARLETEAKKNGYSLNTEIVRRLEVSVRDQDLGAVLFRDQAMFGTMDTLARLIRAVEIHTGHRWNEDLKTYETAVEIIYKLLKNGPRILATGDYPGGIRDFADYGALAAIERMIRVDRERREETAEDSDHGLGEHADA